MLNQKHIIDKLTYAETYKPAYCYTGYYFFWKKSKFNILRNIFLSL